MTRFHNKRGFYVYRAQTLYPDTMYWTIKGQPALPAPIAQSSSAFGISLAESVPFRVGTRHALPSRSSSRLGNCSVPLPAT